MTQPKKILFDFGDTLKLDDFDREAWIKRWLELSGNPDKIDENEVRKVADDLIAATNTIKVDYSMEFSRQQFENNLCARLGIKLIKSHKELNREFVDTAHKKDVLAPGVLKMLDGLSSMNITCAVVSNSLLDGDALAYALEKHDLLKFMKFVISSADYGFRKPHPQIFKTALKKLTAAAKETWFIGDSLEMDIAGANQSGLTSVWYNPKERRSTEITPTYTIKHWNELSDIL